MILHCSEKMERFAMRAHFVWAMTSLVHGIFGLAAAYWFAPFAQPISPIGAYAYGLYYGGLGIFIFGVGGFIFHLYGAFDHLANLRNLASRVRGKKASKKV